MRSRRLQGALILAAAIHAGIAATIATAVLPAVVADAFPAATPVRAVPALWVITAANLLLALWYFAIGAGHLHISAIARFAWAIGLVLSLLVTAPLLDAAFSYWSHGQAMRGASIALFGCFVGGVFCAVLIFVNYRRQNHAAGGV